MAVVAKKVQLTNGASANMLTVFFPKTRSVFDCSQCS